MTTSSRREACKINRRELTRERNLGTYRFKSRWPVVAALFLALGVGHFARALADTGPAYKKVVVADGIYQYQLPDVDDIEVNGNSIAIEADHDILVFDTNVLPSAAQLVLADLRQISNKPVRYVVNSHWHPDHWDGNELYAREFPDLEIIASATTRRLMENTMHVYIRTLDFESRDANKQLERALKSGKSADGKVLSEQDREEIRDDLRAERNFLTEYQGLHPVLPTLTFGDTLTLFHGGREFRLLQLPGHTAGDTVLYLPTEKIVLVGDLLVYPVPYLASAHPTAWIASLKTLSQLDATTFIPGHGPVLHDRDYLNLVADSLQSVVDQVHAALLKGMSLAETQKFVNLGAIKLKFTHNDPQLNAEFDGNFAPIVRQAYDEATEELELYQ
jgi:cyclase